MEMAPIQNFGGINLAKGTYKTVISMMENDLYETYTAGEVTIEIS